MQIAAVPACVRHPLPLYRDDGSGLRACRDRAPDGTFQRRHLDIVSQGGLIDRDRDRAKEVLPFPLEDGMRPDMDEHVEVAPRTAAEPGFALTGDAQAHAAIDSGRDADRDRARHRGPAAAAALRAGVAEDCSGSAATRAGGDLCERPKNRAL